VSIQLIIQEANKDHVGDDPDNCQLIEYTSGIDVDFYSFRYMFTEIRNECDDRIRYTDGRFHKYSLQIFSRSPETSNEKKILSITYSSSTLCNIIKHLSFWIRQQLFIEERPTEKFKATLNAIMQVYPRDNIIIDVSDKIVTVLLQKLSMYDEIIINPIDPRIARHMQMSRDVDLAERWLYISNYGEIAEKELNILTPYIGHTVQRHEVIIEDKKPHDENKTALDGTWNESEFHDTTHWHEEEFKEFSEKCPNRKELYKVVSQHVLNVLVTCGIISQNIMPRVDRLYKVVERCIPIKYDRTMKCLQFSLKFATVLCFTNDIGLTDFCSLVDIARNWITNKVKKNNS